MEKTRAHIVNAVDEMGKTVTYPSIPEDAEMAIVFGILEYVASIQTDKDLHRLKTKYKELKEEIISEYMGDYGGERKKMRVSSAFRGLGL